MSRWSRRDRRWRLVAEQVKDRDGHQCQTCGATDDLTVDHVVAVSKLIAMDRLDQAYDPAQLVTLCRSCNASKGDRGEGRAQIVGERWAGLLGLPAQG